MHSNDPLASVCGQWKGRERLIRLLGGLLSPHIPSPSSIIVHGPSHTGKSSVLHAVLDAYSAADATSFPYTFVKCAECITARHLLVKILASVVAVLRDNASGGEEGGEWIDDLARSRCEHISVLVNVLGDALARAGEDKFVLVLDDVDALREGGMMLLAGLTRVAESIPSLTIIFVLKLTPRPLLLQSAGVPHVYFPPYTRSEALSILSSPPASLPPQLPGLPSTTVAKLYLPFLTTLYDSLIGPTLGTIPVFRSAAEKLWPRFVSPITSGETPPGGAREWDFTRLLVKQRGLFRQVGEEVLVHHIVDDDDDNQASVGGPGVLGSTSTSVKKHDPLPSLPFTPTLLLTAAYLAAHIPPRLDVIFFSKFSSSSLSARNKRAHHRRRLKVLSLSQQAHDPDNDNDEDNASSSPRKKPSRRGAKSSRPRTKITKATLSSALNSRTSSLPGASLIHARSFPLERLLAIYRAIHPHPPPPPTSANNNSNHPSFADNMYPELATLQRLRLLVPAGAGGAGGGGSVDVGEKWCLNSGIAVTGATATATAGAGADEWIAEMARGVGVEVGEWIAGGLD
ncbi:hypothetical protein AJ80_02809 [Polytolypa hystricis UAMH7299]|uniref:Uncharacterized protein n=1 Tax=Polytolypa hystricis (strain UAMH7299) TaxID=1447883 RepID=A0A2B7YQN3_POLH7|nr:hypothetical protein AJ80_02809 [Polytolypa hystricis UAMH7299]